jgi:hypothetical protein
MHQDIPDETYRNEIFRVCPLPLSLAQRCDGHPLDIAAAVVTHLEHGSRD